VFVSRDHLLAMFPSTDRLLYAVVLQQIRWYDLKYTITASGSNMNCADKFFCPLPVSKDSLLLLLLLLHGSGLA
jgi:hypothetical protein